MAGARWRAVKLLWMWSGVTRWHDVQVRYSCGHVVVAQYPDRDWSGDWVGIPEPVQECGNECLACWCESMRRARDEHAARLRAEAHVARKVAAFHAAAARVGGGR